MKLYALSFLFSAGIVPFASVSATQYKCDGIATFHGIDDAKNPTVPTKDTLNLMADEMLETFTTAYQGNSDMNMISDRFAKFSMRRDRSSDGVDTDVQGSNSISFMESTFGGLRAKKPAGYAYRYSSYIGFTCRWCRDDDDFVLTSTGYDSIEEVLTNSQEHANWESAFCDLLESRNGFKSASLCKIELKNCVPETPEEIAANKVTSADNYIVSDLRAVMAEENKDGLVFTLEAIEAAVTDQPLSTSE
ncbi:hypothetical protein IV203_000625 [Nitzschia inconspicua]|uniref:Uncharacterized protein n=1 Tax=Nitzschia inconspicua TaxID=303405 RepID=A0A9K3L569_9STRA|nr:hypothetical protein IV203_000625 [Nitzschia inconspicua]